jgi:hypothetical protein
MSVTQEKSNYSWSSRYCSYVATLTARQDAGENLTVQAIKASTYIDASSSAAAAIVGGVSAVGLGTAGFMVGFLFT